MQKLFPFVFLFLFNLLSAQTVDFQESNLPIIVINTGGQEIPETVKITAGMSIIDNGPGQINHPTDPPNGYNGLIGIELRGASSLTFEKKNYSIETRDLAGDDLKVPLLGMPPESDWALIGPLNDKSLLRDMLAYWLAGRVMPWAPRTRYVEAMLNGDYIGVYLLTETVKRDPNRVDIAKLKDSDLAGDSLTGGYLLAFDKTGIGVGGDWASPYPPMPGAAQQTWIQIVYPKSDDIQPEQRAYIEDHVTAFENALNQWAPNTTPTYENWIDVDSWIDYLLVSEITKNTDAYRLSAFFYKDRDDNDPLLKMGPVWDFNIAFGIGDYCEGQYYEGWAKDFNTVCDDDAWLIHFWWEKLLRDTAFQQRIKTRWQELRTSVWTEPQIAACLDSVTTLLAEPQARNFQRWPVLGEYVWPNAFVGQTWAEELDYLDTWLTNRIAWIDGNIMSVGPAVSATGEAAGADAVRVYPNPVTGNVLYFTPGRADATFSLFDGMGRAVVNELAVAGGSMVALPGELPNGLYFYQIGQKDRLLGRGKLVVR